MAQNEVRVCKSFTFDSAHQLPNHRGKCANIHGHTYKLEVTLAGVPVHGVGNDPILSPLLSDDGFVIDFSDVSDLIKKTYVDKMDHAFIGSGKETLFDVIEETGSKVCNIGVRTTAENMAAWICWDLKGLMRGRSGGRVRVVSVRLYETPTSYAEVRAKDIPDDGPVYLNSGGCGCGN